MSNFFVAYRLGGGRWRIAFTAATEEEARAAVPRVFEKALRPQEVTHVAIMRKGPGPDEVQLVEAVGLHTGLSTVVEPHRTPTQTPPLDGAE